MPRSDFSTEKNSSHPAVNEFGGFAADYHHCLGPALADFPRCLPLASLARHLKSREGEPPVSAGSRELAARAQQLAAGPLEEKAWPDFATFIEDDFGRQMMYYPARPSPWSVCVLFRAESGSWSTQLYRDADPIS